jgi:hypothetical protein
MSKKSDNTKRVEVWNVAAARTTPAVRQTIVKVAVRNSLGQFHGATNFVLGQAGSGVQG